ncbi:MAG: OsmC family protein [Nitrospira sp.]|nr:OsmC family protein [Nitrospira sp.]
MEEKEVEGSVTSLEKILSSEGYKEKAGNVSKGILTWEKDLVFTARIRGYAIDFDAEAKEGCIPTDSLLMSLPGCLAIDVVLFMKKMKVEITKFEIETIGERNPVPPKYFRGVDMKIRIAGKGITPKKLDRAISLSQKKYCSVHHSLRKDMDIKVSYIIEEND